MAQGLAKTQTLQTTDGSTVDVNDGELNTRNIDMNDHLQSILLEIRAIRNILSAAFNIEIKPDDMSNLGNGVRV